MELKSGRTNQKLRTRKALVEAAERLLREGKTFTIEEVAEIAMVSRATAYRYFSSVRALILEVGVNPQAALTEGLLDDYLDAPAYQRIGHIQELVYEHIQTREVAFRAFLSASVSPEKTVSKKQTDVRGGWRLKLIEEAIAPCQKKLDTQTYEYLKNALALFIGIEAQVVLKDVCKLPEEETRKILNWASQQLVRSVCKQE